MAKQEPGSPLVYRVLVKDVRWHHLQRPTVLRRSVAIKRALQQAFYQSNFLPSTLSVQMVTVRMTLIADSHTFFIPTVSFVNLGLSNSRVGWFSSGLVYNKNDRVRQALQVKLWCHDDRRRSGGGGLRQRRLNVERGIVATRR